MVATWLFLATNLDTVLVIVAFGADSRYGRLEILTGSYIGFVAGLVAAIGIAVIAAGVLASWTFVLGVIPIAIGIAGLRVRHTAADESTAPGPTTSPRERFAVVTATSIGLTGENIAVFVPFFAALSSGAFVVVIGAYLVGAAVLFAAAVVVGRQFTAVAQPTWIEQWVVPTVLIAVGGYVFMSGVPV